MRPAPWIRVVALAAGLATAALPAGASEHSAPAPPAGLACPSEAFVRRLDDGLAGHADVVDLPGVSIGIVHRGRLVHSTAHGYANRTARMLASADTLYNIASVTKTFTATLALMMSEQGAIDLDAPVARHLEPGMTVPVHADGTPITIRHLLNHTSGLPRDPPNRRNQDTGSRFDPGIWDAYSLADLQAALATTRLAARPGETFVYSNYGYALLGHVLERVAGKPFEPLLRERLLDPLGMTDTAITLSPDQRSRLAAHYWWEDLDRREQDVRARFGEIAAFIGLSSSVNDLSKFVAAHLSPGSPGNPITGPVAAALREGVLPGEDDGPYRFERTLGWHRVSRVDNGDAWFVHTGEVDGHTAGLFLVPEQQLGVVVLQDLGGADGAEAIDRFGEWILRIAGPELARCGSAGG